jgi:hypothetical protein
VLFALLLEYSGLIKEDKTLEVIVVCETVFYSFRLDGLWCFCHFKYVGWPSRCKWLRLYLTQPSDFLFVEQVTEVLAVLLSTGN